MSKSFIAPKASAEGTCIWKEVGYYGACMIGYCGAKGGIGVQYLKFSALHCIALHYIALHCIAKNAWKLTRRCASKTEETEETVEIVETVETVETIETVETVEAVEAVETKETEDTETTEEIEDLKKCHLLTDWQLESKRC